MQFEADGSFYYPIMLQSEPSEAGFRLIPPKGTWTMINDSAVSVSYNNRVTFEDVNAIVILDDETDSLYFEGLEPQRYERASSWCRR